MKNILILAIIFVGFLSCASKIKNPETLPKDIVMKKVLNKNYSTDSTSLKVMRDEIENTIGDKTCEDASKWKVAAIGTKSCGGPAKYIAYPIELEASILPKIKNYTAQQSGFNEKYGIISDCLVEKEPTGILCENGKAVLKY